MAKRDSVRLKVRSRAVAPTTPAHGLRKTSASARGERTRKRILRAAGRCFAERGAKATVEEIARAAGVSKALVYTYFDGKESLLRYVLDQTLRDWSEHNWSEVAELAPESALEGIAVMHRASIDFARRHPVLRTILIRDERLPLSDTDQPLRVGTDRWRKRLIELIERGIERGELRPELDSARTADVIRLWHLAFLDRLYAESLIDVTDPELDRASIEMVQRGLAADRQS